MVTRDIVVTLKKVVGLVKSFLVDAKGNAFGTPDNPISIGGEWTTNIGGYIFVSADSRIKATNGDPLHSTDGSLHTVLSDGINNTEVVIAYGIRAAIAIGLIKLLDVIGIEISQFFDFMAQISKFS